MISEVLTCSGGAENEETENIRTFPLFSSKYQKLPPTETYVFLYIAVPPSLVKPEAIAMNSFVRVL